MKLLVLRCGFQSQVVSMRRNTVNVSRRRKSEIHRNSHRTEWFRISMFVETLFPFSVFIQFLVITKDKNMFTNSKVISVIGQP